MRIKNSHLKKKGEKLLLTSIIYQKYNLTILEKWLSNSVSPSINILHHNTNMYAFVHIKQKKKILV